MDIYRSSCNEDHQLSGGSSSRYRTARSHTISVVMPSTATIHVVPSPPSLLTTLATHAEEKEPETARRAKVSTADNTRQSVNVSKKPVRVGHELTHSSYASAKMTTTSRVEQKTSPTSRNPLVTVADLYDANTHMGLALSLRVEHLKAMEEAHRQAELERRGEGLGENKLYSDTIEEEPDLVVGYNDDDDGAAFRGRRRRVKGHEGSFSSTAHGGTCGTISDVCAAIPSTDPDEFFNWSKQGTTSRSKKKGGRNAKLHRVGHEGSNAHDYQKEAGRSSYPYGRKRDGQPRSLKAKQTHLHTYLSQLHLHAPVMIEGGKPMTIQRSSARNQRKDDDDDDDIIDFGSGGEKEGDSSTILYEEADSVTLISTNASGERHSRLPELGMIRSGGEPSPLSVRTQQSSFSSHIACGVIVEDDRSQSYVDRRNSSLKTHYYLTKRNNKKKLVDTTIDERDGTLTEEMVSEAAEMGHCNHSRDLGHHHYSHDPDNQSITNDGSRCLSSSHLGPPSSSSASPRPRHHHHHKKQYASSFVSDNSIADETVPMTKIAMWSGRPHNKHDEYKHKAPTRTAVTAASKTTKVESVVETNHSSSSSYESSDEETEEEEEHSESDNEYESIAVEKGCESAEEGSSSDSTTVGTPPSSSSSSSCSSSSHASIVDEDDDGVDWDASGSGYSSSSSNTRSTYSH